MTSIAGEVCPTQEFAASQNRVTGTPSVTPHDEVPLHRPPHESIQPRQDDRIIQAAFLNCRPPKGRPDAGVRPSSRGTFLSSGYWVPNYEKGRRVNNIKQRLKPFANHPPPAIQSSPDWTGDDNFRKVEEVNDFGNFDATNRFVGEDEKIQTQNSVYCEGNHKKQNLTPDGSRPAHKNSAVQNQRSASTGRCLVKSERGGGRGGCDGDDDDHSISRQYVTHLRRTSAEIFSRSVSPFHSLSYCRQTNLSRMKVGKTDDDDGGGDPGLPETAGGWKADVSGGDGKSTRQNKMDELMRKKEPETNGDPEESKTSLDAQKSKNGDDMESSLNSKLINKIRFSQIQVPQQKARAGSLTDTSIKREDGCRVRGLSLSASCLPLRPFQLQKPNLPWNRQTNAQHTNSMDRQCQEKFSNYVRVNIRSEKPPVVHLFPRSTNDVDGDVRHSHPVPFTSRDSSSDNKDGGEILPSVKIFQSRKQPVPRIKISTTEQTDDQQKVAPPCLESHFPLCLAGDDEDNVTSFPTDTSSRDSTPESSSSIPPPPTPPPPPIPPRKKSLYQNPTPVRCPHHNLPPHNISNLKTCADDLAQPEVGDRSGPCAVEKILAGERLPWIPNTTSFCDGYLTKDRDEFKRGESQDYVMALIKHERPQSSQSEAFRFPRQAAATTMRSSESADVGGDSRQQTAGACDVLTGVKQTQASLNSPTESCPNKFFERFTRLQGPPGNPPASPKVDGSPVTSDPPLPQCLPASPNEKLRKFVLPCLWINGTPHDRLLISLLEPSNEASDLDRSEFKNSYRRLLQLDSPCNSSTNISSLQDPTSLNSSFSSLSASLDNTSSGESTGKSSLPHSPASPFIRSNLSVPKSHEQNGGGGSVSGDDVTYNPTIDDSINTIANNYNELELKIKNLLATSTDQKTREKFASHLEQMDTVLHLIIKLTDQMTKLSSGTKSFKEDTAAKQNRIVDKLVEARSLKISIDKKGEELSKKIRNSIDEKSYEYLEFLLKGRIYVTLLSRSNVFSARRKSSRQYDDVSSN